VSETAAQTPQAYTLDIDTIKDIEDIKTILDGLGIVCSTGAPKFEQLSKYFTQPLFRD